MARGSFFGGSLPTGDRRPVEDLQVIALLVVSAGQQNVSVAAAGAATFRPYDHLMLHCLAIAPNYADLSVLRTVLGELDTKLTATSQLLAGTQLADLPLNRFDYAVAVLPLTEPGGMRATTPPAIYVEMGIVLGRGLPLFAMIEDLDEDLLQLGGLASDVWIEVGTYSNDRLRLQLGLFTQVMSERRRVSGAPSPEDSPSAQTAARSPGIAVDLDVALRTMDVERRALALLRASGARVMEPPRAEQGQVDAAVLIPGTERLLGPILVEVKNQRGNVSLTEAFKQLVVIMGQRRATFGLLIYDGPYQDPPPMPYPIVVMHVDDLHNEVARGTLGHTLVRARNDLVHGRRGGA
ncbi:hypothetical protein [Frankia sp. R82]|uniref:hypothetical protein n=1 Tax=Frankia sp. R82 TaxID=2950553 RepID=UPI0020439D72|nr:hypothetical protein [Frankia sp. R82]MCM3883166.1 hypothetical protein [Frankia sp. R82]